MAKHNSNARLELEAPRDDLKRDEVVYLYDYPPQYQEVLKVRIIGAEHTNEVVRYHVKAVGRVEGYDKKEGKPIESPASEHDKNQRLTFVASRSGRPLESRMGHWTVTKEFDLELYKRVMSKEDEK